MVTRSTRAPRRGSSTPSVFCYGESWKCAALAPPNWYLVGPKGPTSFWAPLRAHRLTLLILIFFALASSPLFAQDCDILLRQGRGGLYNYDGDTVYILLPCLPQSIEQMSLRLAGVDTPEINGDCNYERELAVAARDTLADWMRNAQTLSIELIEWDRYGGRVVGELYINGHSASDLLIQAGLGVPYDGGRKQHSWCR